MLNGLSFGSRHPAITVNTVNPPKKNKLLGRAIVIANPEPIKTLPQIQREVFKNWIAE